MEENNIPISEVTIKVPWGYIAGKAWGYSKGHPVLALHGWLDNAGTFNTLIPLLSRDLYVVAIDWPGHGLSSPRPKGEFYHYVNLTVDMKYVIEAKKVLQNFSTKNFLIYGLGWSRFSILAHSMGAGAAALFAASLPEYVDRMVLIEGIAPVVTNADEIPQKFGTAFKQLDAMQRKTEVIYPSLEACIVRMMEGNSNLTRDAATVLAERGTSPVDNGFVFTRDIKVKFTSIFYYTEEMIASYIQSINCPVLVIMAEKSAFSFDMAKYLVQLMSEGKMIVVPGNHHVHLNNAERVGPAVNEHLLKNLSPSVKSQL